MGARRQRNPVLILLAILLVTALLISGTGCSSARSRSLQRAFAQVKDGDPEDRVLGLMGKPDGVFLPGDRRYNHGTLEDCVKEYKYEILVLPEHWDICFNSRGRVIWRSHDTF
jgi:hypothetical protein